MDIVWARHGAFKHRFGTVSVTLSSRQFKGADMVQGDLSSSSMIQKTNVEMNTDGRVRYEWPETSYSNDTRYIKIQQEDRGELEGDKWRGLEISSVKVYGSKCD